MSLYRVILATLVIESNQYNSFNQRRYVMVMHHNRSQ